MIKIGLLIPTRGDRPEFLAFALKQIKKQTLQPDFIEIVDDKPLSDKPDVTWRYRIGCKRLADNGCDLIGFWEDDDYYDRLYLEIMSAQWEQAQRPDIFGINQTVYYNLFHQAYDEMTHGHASMMSTFVTPKINTIDWGDDNYSFTDMHIWTKTNLRKQTISFKHPIAIGIKHGMGLCGGGGHHWPVTQFKKRDPDWKYLSSVVDPESLAFYKSVVPKSKYVIHKSKLAKNPFLTIITRRSMGKRHDLFKDHQHSIRNLYSLSREQIFIEDYLKQGMLAANTSFQFVTDMIEGQYIHLLDDDDFYTDYNFIEKLQGIANGYPDVIVFKMKILTGDGDEIYPKPDSWKSREPKRGQIGGSCFFVRKCVYAKYIHLFAQPSFGDWHFISAVLADKALTVKWIDTVMCETGKVSRGK